jgi:MFS transporter, DHA2 family, multidrug resistance protein
MAVFHLLRNDGSILFISICVAEIVRTTARNYSQLGEMISPLQPPALPAWVMSGWSTEMLLGLAGSIGLEAALY